MAKSKVFGPFDSKLKVWMNPMFFYHTGQAERAWGDIVNDGNTLPGRHPEDFTLYQIGEYDEDTSVITSITPVHVMSAVQAKKKPVEPAPLFNQQAR